MTTAPTTAPEPGDDYDVEIEDLPTPSRDAATAWTALRVVGEVVDELYASRKRLLGALRDLPTDVPPTPAPCAGCGLDALVEDEPRCTCDPGSIDYASDCPAHASHIGAGLLAADEPPAGEGAALIAATEQEIAPKANPDRWTPMINVIADERAAWEATARRLAALLDGQRGEAERLAGELSSRIESAERLERLGDDDPPTWRETVKSWTRLRDKLRAMAAPAPASATQADDPVPVQATTHGGAGEAPETTQGGWKIPVHDLGDGRVVFSARWDGEKYVDDFTPPDAQAASAQIEDVRRLAAEVRQIGTIPAIAAAGWLVDLARERDRETRLRRSETAEADRLAADLRAERDKALQDVRTAIELRRQADDDAGTLRRALEQVAHKLDAFGSCYFGCHKAAHANAAYLRSLAATAPTKAVS